MMRLHRRVIGPVLLLVILFGCAPFAKQGAFGPWNGRLAPAIEGADSHGRAMRLGDYKGKVVVLSFWHSL